MIARLKGYRTVIVNVIALVPPTIDAVLPIVAEIAGLAEVQALIPADKLPMYALGLAVANIYLRSITTTPVGKR